MMSFILSIEFSDQFFRALCAYRLLEIVFRMLSHGINLLPDIQLDSVIFDYLIPF